MKALPFKLFSLAMALTAVLIVSCKENTSEPGNSSIHTDKTFTNEGITSDTLLRGEDQYQDTVNAVREKAKEAEAVQTP